MTAAEIEAAVGEPQAQILRETGLSARTPLWYYILAESASHPSDHLGPVGSTIVAEVLIELVRRSEDSILGQVNWNPTLGAAPEWFTLRDLLRLGGVLQLSSNTNTASAVARQGKGVNSEGDKAMTIIEKVRAKREELVAEVKKSREKGIEPVKTRANRDKAVAAIHAGIRSTAWKTYMEQFADTPEQLMRLMGTDGTLDEPTMVIKRAYLVANAVCGSGTTTDLDRFVDTIDH